MLHSAPLERGSVNLCCNSTRIKNNFSDPTEGASIEFFEFWESVLKNSLVHKYKLLLPIQIYLSDIWTCNIFILLGSELEQKEENYISGYLKDLGNWYLFPETNKSFFLDVVTDISDWKSA